MRLTFMTGSSWSAVGGPFPVTDNGTPGQKNDHINAHMGERPAILYLRSARSAAERNPPTLRNLDHDGRDVVASTALVGHLDEGIDGSGAAQRRKLRYFVGFEVPMQTVAAQQKRVAT
jgi:hypothetical protein